MSDNPKHTVRMTITGVALENFIKSFSYSDVRKAISDKLPKAAYDGIRAGRLRIEGDSNGFRVVPNEKAQ